MNALGLSLLIVLASACGSMRASGPGPSHPYAPAPASQRDTQRASELAANAVEKMQTDPARAEDLLRAALAADLFFGPAHNNLGVLYLKQGKLYEAAQEFEWARKLLPGHPDPRVNLALTLERAGQVDEALTTYSTALDLYPGYLPAIQGLASALVREGRDHEQLPDWLGRIAMEAESAEWRDWARLRLARE